MKPLYPVAALAFTLLLGDSRLAQAGGMPNGRVQLKGDALQEAYLGQTLDLAYNDKGFAGKKHHTETHNADGSTDYDEGGIKLDGEWSLSARPALKIKYATAIGS